MRFIITYEDDGYELRYWNELTEEVGEVFAKAWTQKKFGDELKQKGVRIVQRELYRALKIISAEEKPFVVLKSKENSGGIETLSNETFVVDESLTYGDR